MTEALVPSLREYTACYGLTRRRVDLPSATRPSSCTRGP